MLLYQFVKTEQFSLYCFCDISDYSRGFGGKYGVQTDRQDKSALGYDSQEKVALHPSQTDMSKGFGGKFGVDAENKDKVRLFSVESVSQSMELHVFRKLVFTKNILSWNVMDPEFSIFLVGKL